MHKQKIQDQQYSFPYHHIPFCDDSQQVWRWRSLRWGFEYWCYMMHIRQRIMEMPAKSWLDVGCGDGRLISLLAENKDMKATGVDLCQEAIAHARAFNPGGNFICGPVSAVEQKFDLVTAIEVMEHIDDALSFVDSLCERLDNGGRLIIGVPALNKPRSAKHYRHYDEKLLIEQINPEKHDLTVESIEHIFAGNDTVYSLYTKITDNRLWFVGIRFLERLIWQRVWNKLRISTPSRAFHVLVALRKDD